MLKIKGIFTAILTIIIIIVILYLTYVTTKKIGDGTGMKASSEMKILDRLPLENDRMLAIVQIHEEYFLMGVTPQSISVIRELDGDELWIENLNMQDRDNMTVQPFKEVYNKIKNIKDPEKRG